MRNKGRITTWHDDRGYGFITPFDGSEQVFVHVSALGHRSRRPVLNDVVTYSESRDKKGRARASRATLAGDRLVKRTPRKSSEPAMLFAIAFLAAVGALVATGRLSHSLLIGYGALSLVTFVAYASDKSAARSGRWRTGEHTLLLLGLAGGWPGALLAQELLRHKSKKTSFRAWFWTTVVMHFIALAWLHSQSAQDVVREWFG